MSRLIRLYLALWLSAAAGFAVAQNPQSTLAPIVSVNAAYNNGVSPGYRPTAGSGLVLNIGPGTANCSGTIATYTGGTLSMTASVVNYVYLNTSASCIPAVKTSPFGSSDIPVATVTAGSSAITATCNANGTSSPSGSYPCVIDDRTIFFLPGNSSSGLNQLTGDVTAGPGSGSQAATLATVNSGPGACGDSTHVCQVTTNGKGLVTAQTPVAITATGTALTINTFPGSGTLTNGQQLLLIPNAFTTNIVVPSGCTNSQAGAQVLSTGSVSFTVVKHAGGPTGSSTTLCTAAFTSSGLTGSFSGAGGTVAPGDYIEIDAPATADATLATVGLGIYATH